MPSKVKLPGKENLSFNNKKHNGKKQNRMYSFLRGLGMYFLIGLAGLIFFASVFSGGRTGDEVPISQVIDDAKNGQVQSLSVEGDKVTAQYKEKDKVVT